MMKKLNWLFSAATIATVMMTSAQSLADDKAPAPVKSDDRGSDKLDLKKLEDKYWSAKDTDFNVVQNRTYTKAGKFFVSLGYGPLLNDAYSYGRMTNLAAGYYFNERFGLEVAYENGNIKDSDSTTAFINSNQFAPDHNRFQNYTSLNAVVVPFYAKMSFFDRKIMYFDIQFAAGVGQMKYQVQRVDGNPTIGQGVNSAENKSTIGYNFDVTQQLFFSEHFAVRFDIKNKWTTQDKERYYLQSGQDRNIGTTQQQDTTMLLGLTIFF